MTLPNTPPPASAGAQDSSAAKKEKEKSLKSKLKRGLGHWFKDDSELPSSTTATLPATLPTFTKDVDSKPHMRRRVTEGGTDGDLPKLKERTDSERRDKLQEVRPTRKERRTVSMDRRRQSRNYDAEGQAMASPRGTSMSFNPNPRSSGLSVSMQSPRATVTSIHDPRGTNSSLVKRGSKEKRESVRFDEMQNKRGSLRWDEHDRRGSMRYDHQRSSMGVGVPEPPMSPATNLGSTQGEGQDWYYDDGYDIIEEELEWRWILNLSMHFRERSDREKFFVTYAETPHLRRRITVSCDYKNAEPGSLEDDLSHLEFQRDKSTRIYEAIRESLLNITFYDTITNLKLETEGGRLHVHVIEDVNEIIHFPHMKMIDHLDCDLYREGELDFDCHLSGFVYKVRHGSQVFIKKEIPGPDTIDEFLYEINALHALQYSDSVIKFGGLVVDDRQRHVKGLLIAFAPNGSLIDLIYAEHGALAWSRRERWAYQIIRGLSEIHEAGFVQGDFTMSNMVLDENDDVKIIDINRRGCPIGWEPPEISALIDSQQRIGMFIGVKSDLFQLGMVLWGLVFQVDEPEAQARPLTMDQAPADVPDYFRSIVMACLSTNPKHRPGAKDLLARFPDLREESLASPVSPTSMDILVDGGQVIHVTHASKPSSPKSPSLRVNPLHSAPILNGDFVHSPAVMTPMNGYLQHDIPDTQEERLEAIQTMPVEGLDRPADLPPDSPASEIVMSPPDERGEMDWQHEADWKIERKDVVTEGSGSGSGSGAGVRGQSERMDTENQLVFETPKEEFPPRI